MDDTSPTTLHRRAWDLIPWLVAGSVSDADRQLVEQHAAGCADCRDELAFHRSLRAGMLADAQQPPHDAEPALQRLWARIEEHEAAPLVGETARAGAPHRMGWTRLLAAAVVVQAIGLAVLAGRLWERPSVAEYETLSQPAPTLATIRLVPATTLRLGELQALLQRSGLQIVESSADGTILGLAPRSGTAAPVGETLVRLRAEPGVLLAEPVIDAATTRP